MIAKVFIVSCLLAVASAQLLVPSGKLVHRFSSAGELAARQLAYAEGRLTSPDGYTFRYGVSDPISGDNKEQEETSNGDALTGRYSFLQPDGRRRVVNYSSRGLEGFIASVTYE